MHHTALQNCKEFFDCYSEALAKDAVVQVVDVGSQDVNGSLRQVCPQQFRYVGVDSTAGPGVDIVLDDPYALPFETSSVDIVLSSSCFEHAEMFWLVFLEALRILKPDGLFYLNAPSNGDFHRYPVDCWRFYPDSGRALITWAKRNGIDAALLESFTSTQIGDQWNDFVAVFLKDERLRDRFASRILDKKANYTNGLRDGGSDMMNFSVMPEDRKKMAVISQIIGNQIKVN
jgi:SAM-dependent methyltransferase